MARIAVDYVFPPWRWQSGLHSLYRGIACAEFKAEAVFEDSEREQWIAANAPSSQRGPTSPSAYTRTRGLPGHSQNSGSCLPDETARYATRLDVARGEMRRDIDTIVESRRDAIVVIAGGHGPFLTGDCLYMAQYDLHALTAAHLADRYGATLAIRWPGSVPGEAAQITVIQDVVAAIAAYMLDDRRVWTHRVPAQTVGFGDIPDRAVRDASSRSAKTLDDHCSVTDEPCLPA